MMIRALKLLTVLLILALCFVQSAKAGLYGESVSFADWQDQRTYSLVPDYNPNHSGGGLGGNWPYSFSISWNISYDLDSMLWHYEYNLSAAKKDISHFILEVSDDAQQNDFMNIVINGYSADVDGPQTWTKAGNQILPNSLYGIKFDEGGSSVVYSFDSIRNPVWGNFYAKGGVDHGGDSDDYSDSDSDNENYYGKRNNYTLINAYNNAFAMDDFYSNNEIDFIVRPNGPYPPPIVPEPVSSTLFIVGGAALGFRRFRKRVNLKA